MNNDFEKNYWLKVFLCDWELFFGVVKYVEDR